MKPIVWLQRLLIALDQLLNTLLRGDEDETMSSRCWRENRRCLVTLIDHIFWFDPDHCRTSYESELLKRKSWR